jgi:competence protein ComFC
VISVKKIVGILNDFFFPSACTVCGLVNIGTKNILCESCLGSLQLFPPVLHPWDFEDRAVFWDSLHSFSHYDNSMMRMIHQYKNGHSPGLASYFAEHLMKMIENEKMGFDLITSVPPSRKKMRKRGFDPSKVMASLLSSRCGIPYEPLLKESGIHGEQKTLGADDRYCNAVGRFVFSGGRNLEGKRIILADDVMTTGATINESARILKKNGAGIVLSLTVARVDVKKLENCRS